MEYLLSAIIATALIGGWTAMWLVWTLDGDVRSWLAGLLMPKAWLAGGSRKSIATLSPHGFSSWLTNSSMAPMWAVQLCTCRYCWSAHVAGTGALLVLCSQTVPLPLLPLSWAFGAALGNLLYDRIRPNRD